MVLEGDREGEAGLVPAVQLLQKLRKEDPVGVALGRLQVRQQLLIVVLVIQVI